MQLNAGVGVGISAAAAAAAAPCIPHRSTVLVSIAESYRPSFTLQNNLFCSFPFLAFLSFHLRNSLFTISYCLIYHSFSFFSSEKSFSLSFFVLGDNYSTALNKTTTIGIIAHL